MKSTRIDNDNLRHAAYHGNFKRMIELLEKGADPDFRSQSLPLTKKQKLNSYSNVMDLSAIGKKPIETLTALFGHLNRETLEKLYQYKKDTQHSTIHLGKTVLKYIL